MSLEQRIEKFDNVTSRFSHEKPCPLLAKHKIDPIRLERLKIAASLFLMQSLPDKSRLTLDFLSREKEFLEEVSRQQSLIKNLTPNGMVVPKKELSLEYNLFAAAFGDVMASLRIEDYLDAWVVPPALRFKDGNVSQSQLNRNYASEYRHSEAWIAVNTKRCVTVFLPLLGDFDNNSVDFFYPPEDFSEEWLNPVSSYLEGKHISDRYDRVNVQYEAGYLYLAEVATMHQTVRGPSAGPRVSMDISVLLKQDAGATIDEIRAWSDRSIHPDPITLKEIGLTKLWIFEDSLSDSHDDKKHPSANRSLISFE